MTQMVMQYHSKERTLQIVMYSMTFLFIYIFMLKVIFTKYISSVFFWEVGIVKNSFIEIDFTYHTIPPFKLSNSVFSTFTQLYTYQHNLILEHVLHPKKKSCNVVIPYYTFLQLLGM